MIAAEGKDGASVGVEELIGAPFGGGGGVAGEGIEVEGHVGEESAGVVEHFAVPLAFLVGEGAAGDGESDAGADGGAEEVGVADESRFVEAGAGAEGVGVEREPAGEGEGVELGSEGLEVVEAVAEVVAAAHEWEGASAHLVVESPSAGGAVVDDEVGEALTEVIEEEIESVEVVQFGESGASGFVVLSPDGSRDEIEVDAEDLHVGLPDVVGEEFGDEVSGLGVSEVEEVVVVWFGGWELLAEEEFGMVFEEVRVSGSAFEFEPGGEAESGGLGASWASPASPCG